VCKRPNVQTKDSHYITRYITRSITRVCTRPRLWERSVMGILVCRSAVGALYDQYNVL
jgi:hypothetical protein